MNIPVGKGSSLLASLFKPTAKPETLNKAKYYLPHEPFIKRTAQEQDESIAIVETLKTYTELLRKNLSTILYSTNSSEQFTVFDEIQKVMSSIGMADGSSLEEKDWVVLTTKNGEDLWMHIDVKQGKIGFYKENPKEESSGKNSPFYHTYTDSQGEQVTKTYQCIYEEYQVGKKGRLRSADFAEDLQFIQNSAASPEEAKSTLINFLKAKELVAPPPDTHPLFYRKKDPLDPISKNEDILSLALGVKGVCNQPAASLVLERYRFLSQLDQTANLVKAEEVTLDDIVPQITQLRARGGDLIKRNELRSEEINALAAILEKGYAIIEELNSKQPKGASYPEIEKPKTQKLSVGSKPLTVPSLKRAVPTTPTLASAQLSKSSSLPKEVQGLDFPIKPLQPNTSKNQVLAELEACKGMMQNPTNLVAGLNALSAWIQKKETSANLSKEEILFGLADAIPFIDLNIFKSLSDKELNEVLAATHTLFQTVKDQEFTGSAGHSLRIENINNTCLLSLALLSHVELSAIAKMHGDNTEFQFSRESFISMLKSGFILTDPELQIKAQQLGKAYYHNLNLPDRPLLGFFDLNMEAKKTENQLFLNKLATLAASKLSNKETRKQIEESYNAFREFIDWKNPLVGGSNTFDQAYNLFKSKLEGKLKLERENDEIIDQIKKIVHPPYIKEFNDIIDQAENLKSASSEADYQQKLALFQKSKSTFLATQQWTTSDELIYVQDSLETLEAGFGLMKKIEEDISSIRNKYDNNQYPIFKDQLGFLQDVKLSKEDKLKKLEDLGNSKQKLAEPFKKIFPNLSVDSIDLSDPAFISRLRNYTDSQKVIDALNTSLALVGMTFNPLPKETLSDKMLINYLLLAHPNRNEVLGNEGQLIMDALYSSNSCENKKTLYPLDASQDVVALVSAHMVEKKISLGESISFTLENLFVSNDELVQNPLNIKFSGYKNRPKGANEVVKPETETSKFFEIAIDQRDEAWKTIEFIAEYPNLINEHPQKAGVDYYRGYYAHLFNFETMGHLMEMEGQGVHNLVSEGIPRQLNKAIQSLENVWNDPKIKPEARVEAGEALAKTLVLAAKLHDFLSIMNEKRGNRIDLSKYGAGAPGEPLVDYKTYFFQNLGKNVDSSLSGIFIGDVPSLFFESLTIKDIEMAASNKNSSLADALVFYKAVLDCRMKDLNVHSDEIGQIVNKHSIHYLNDYLRIYYALKQHTPIPEGLTLERKGIQLHLKYHDQTKEIFGYSDIDKAITELGVVVDDTNWLSSDIPLQTTLKKILGKPLSAFLLRQEGERYFVESTPYSFDKTGKIYIIHGKNEFLTLSDLDEGKSQKLMSKFGMEHQFDINKDLLFENPVDKKIWIYREGQPRYWVGQQKDGSEYLIRLKDNAVCFSTKPAVWHTQDPDGTCEPISKEIGRPPGEYRYVTVKGETRLESLNHSGFFLSNAMPKCQNIDLTGIGTSTLLQNEEGEMILICAVANTDPRTWSEFKIVNDRIVTQDPWDLIGLLMRVDNSELTLSHVSSLFLNSPKGEKQLAISESLRNQVRTIPDPQNFGAWMEFLILDRSIRGREGGLTNLEVPNVLQLSHAYLAYTTQKDFMPNHRASKETERLFLNEMRNWFSGKEVKLMKEIKDEKKLKTSDASIQDKAATFLKKHFTPSEKEAQLLSLRILYKNFFSQTKTRWNQLQFGEQPVEGKNWKKIDPIIKLEKVGNRLLDLTNAFKQKGAWESFVDELLGDEIIQDSHVNSSESAEKLASNLLKGSLIDLVQAYDSDDDMNKEDFVTTHMVEFYNLAHTISGEDREKLLKWLDLVPEKAISCKWIAKIVSTPTRYPSMKKLLKNEIDYRRLLEATTDEKKIEDIQKKHVASVNAHFSTSFTEIITAAAKLAFTALKTSFIAKTELRPLKLKISDLSKPFIVFKKRATPPSVKSPIADVDLRFNVFFSEWHAKFLEVKAANKGPQPGLQTDTAALKKAQKEIDDYRGTLKAQTFTLTSPTEFESFSEKLKVEIEQCETQLKTMESSLILQANSAKNAREQVLHRQRPPLAWEDLVSLVHKGQVYAYEKHLADPSQYHALEEGFYKYLAIKTRMYQMQRVSQTLSEINPQKPSQESLQKLSEQMKEERAYNGANREDLKMLFYESASPKGLFKQAQYEKIRQSSEDEVQLAQMPTGFGKTDYVIPMINERAKDVREKENFDQLSAAAGAKTKAAKASTKQLPVKMKLKKGALNTKQLIMNLWPGPLVGLNKEAISKKIRAATGGEVEQFSFSKSSKMDSVQLEYLLLRLERASSKGIPISVRASDVVGVCLHLKETLEHLDQDDVSIEMRKCAELYGKILIILHTNTFATIDEEHEVLDPMQKTIYTVGESTRVPEYAVNFASDLFAVLLKQPAFKEIMEKNQTLLPAQAEDKIKTLLRDEKMLKTLATLLNVPEKDYLILQKFLQGEVEIPEKWSKDPEFQQKLCLAKGYFTVILKAGISGAVNEHYGLSKLHYQGNRFAIPYEKKDVPKENSENPTPSSYQNADEILIKTFRTYHFSGLSKENIVDLFAQLVSDIKFERQTGKALSDIPQYAQLNKLAVKAGIDIKMLRDQVVLAPDADPIPILQSWITPDAFNKMSKDTETISQFVKQCVAPEIKLFESSIDMTPQEMLKMFSQSDSVSATPQLPNVHSLRTQFVNVTGSTGKAFDEILTKTKSIRKIPTQEGEFIQGIAEACIDKDRKVRAVADPSGLTKFDLPFVLKMAEALSESRSPITHIIYFDNQKGTLIRYDIKNKSAANFVSTDHLPETTLTLYDQARSTGTDIVQSPDAREILLAAPDSTTVVQAGQGAGRMRQLDKGHTLEIWIASDKQYTISELLAKMVLNAEQVNLQKNKVGLQQLMMADLKGAMLRKMLGLPIGEGKGSKKTCDVDAMLRHYRAFRDEFIGHTPYDPAMVYGSIGQAKTGEENLLAFHSNVLSKVERYFTGAEQEHLQDELSAYVEVIKSVPLPAVDYGAEVGASQELSTQQEVSATSEVSLQTEQDMSINTEQKDKFSWKNVYDWPKKPEELFKLEIKNPPSLRKWQKYKNIDRRIKNLMVKSKGETFVKKAATKVKLKAENIKRSIAKTSYLKENPSQTNKISFVSVRSVIKLELSARLSVGEKFFSDNFFLSSNFSDQIRDNPSPLIDAPNKKHSNQLLLIRDEENGQVSYKAVMIDATDAKQLHTLLEADRMAKNASSDTRRMAIINPDMGIIDQGKNPINPAELDSPEVAALTAQAKMLGGRDEKDCTPAEKRYKKKIEQETNNAAKDKTSKVGERTRRELEMRLKPVDIQAKHRIQKFA